jgi:hypothetical protein
MKGCADMEEKQAFNPYLPCYEYIPDVEPHVFGDRLYVFGSHDKFDGKKYCENDYVCWSAPVNDLSNWRYEGVIYKKIQDPRVLKGNHQLWAPDVVKGKDGRYYLYYCLDDRLGSEGIGIAVSDKPAGKYEFLELVRDKLGAVIGDREGDTVPFDPAVFIDDDGTIYIYSGNGPRTERKIGKEPRASVVMTLEDDMITIKTEPKKLLPVLGESKGTGFEGHEFFEASSIRKIKGRYYLVYSSVNLHELCYAISNKPDKDFRFGGVIISHCDIFPGTDRKKPVNCFGNNHGGIEYINGKYYIFYHRHTNRTQFSRQGCAEEIQILEDGTILQVEVTSCGLNNGPLVGKGTYPTYIVCNLYRNSMKTATFSHPTAMGKRYPYLIQDGLDYEPNNSNRVPPVQYITNAKNGMIAGFKYFIFEKKIREILCKVRGKAKGKLIIRTNLSKNPVGEVLIKPSNKWTEFRGKVEIEPGVRSLYFCYEGRGKFDFVEFTIYI